MHTEVFGLMETTGSELTVTFVVAVFEHPFPSVTVTV